MSLKLFGVFFGGLLLSACMRCPSPETMLPVTPGLSVGITIPGAKWKVASVAPEFLVEAMTEHIAHDLESQNKTSDRVPIEAAVEKQLAANEYFIFNPVSGAHIEVDFSPLAAGESGPTRISVADSARYAADSLEGEEGIADLSHQVGKVRVCGADYTYSLQARYMKHDVATRFYGLIGFVDDSWFFIYYTDSGKDPEDYPQAMQMLRSVQVVRGKR